MLLEHAEQSLTVLPGEIPPSPVPREGVHVDVVEKELSHGVEEVLSVLKVSIDGHGVDAKMLAELAHGEGIDADLVDQRQGGVGDLRSRQPCSCRVLYSIYYDSATRRSWSPYFSISLTI